MSLLTEHRVAILVVDDSVPGPRGGRGQARSVVAENVPCRVNQRGLEHRQVGGRGATVHQFRVQFPEARHLTVNHLIAWTGPDGVARTLSVTGTRLRRAPSMPDVAFAEWFEPGPMAS